MSKKYVWTAAAAAAVAVLATGTVVIARRTRKEPPPVSPTIPRVEDLPLGSADPAAAAS